MGTDVQRISVAGMAELLSMIEQHKGRDIYVLFCGNKTPSTGESWCPDCVKAEPVIVKVFEKVQSGVFIRCTVGDRETWKDPGNEFRVHPQFQLTGIPTLMKWETPRRLGPTECAKVELVGLLIEEDN